ncbi:hypothetical protein [Kitasatospora terrestris]|uniref:Uncharacterized protein n=1 Tax=Kitasatospora terrestris TaxID=258051 RepID=A0ABP9EIE0_9ACTN
MTATNNAPDQTTTDEGDRWQHLLDRLTALEHRIHQLNAATISALDTHLARLETLRHHLAHRPWPPGAADSPGPRRPPLRPRGGPDPAPAAHRPDAGGPAGRRREAASAGGPRTRAPAHPWPSVG